MSVVFPLIQLSVMSVDSRSLGGGVLSLYIGPIAKYSTIQSLNITDESGL